MATTALDVFASAMALIDALVNGNAQNGDTSEYQARTVPILNILLPRLYLYSDTRPAAAGQRQVPAKIVGLPDTLGIDDGLARAVLPYGLAAHLLAGDNPAQSNLWFQRYEEELNVFRNVPSIIEPIGDQYGICGESE
jgi:hypothetical protein